MLFKICHLFNEKAKRKEEESSRKLPLGASGQAVTLPGL